LIETIREGCPRIILRYEDNHLADFFNKNIFAGKPELFWESYSLTSSINENFGGLHDEPPCIPDRYQSIYRQGLYVKIKNNCKLRVDAPGALHHVIFRGIERRKIFRIDYDRNNFLMGIENRFELIDQSA
jgi:hypothetical protein